MTDLVRDEILVEGETMPGCQRGERLCCLLRRARLHFDAALDQHTVSEILIDGATVPQIFEVAEAHPGGFDRRSGGRYPARAALEKARGICVSEGVGLKPQALELKKDGVLADDLKQSLVGKSLFMKPQRGWR